MELLERVTKLEGLVAGLQAHEERLTNLFESLDKKLGEITKLLITVRGVLLGLLIGLLLAGAIALDTRTLFQAFLKVVL